MSDSHIAPGADPASDRPLRSSNSGWWHRNRWSLLAFFALALATPIAIVGNSVRRQRATNPTVPIVVAEGQTAEYGTATVGPARAIFVTDDDAPPNTKVVQATIALNNAASLNCRPPTLVETTGSRRTFGSTTLLRSDGDFGASFCGAAIGDRYELSLIYLVPDDVADPLVIRFVSQEEIPRYVEFKVQPEVAETDRS